MKPSDKTECQMFRRRVHKRIRAYQTVTLIIFGIISIKVFSFGSSRLVLGSEDMLVVSSVVACKELPVGAECAMKQWIHQNSFKNWKDSGFQVLILGDYESDCDNLSDDVMCQKHDCMHPNLGLPYVRCLIQTGMDKFPTSSVVFTNDDILFEGLERTVKDLKKTFGHFVALGRRTNVPLDDIIDVAKLSHGADKHFVETKDLFSRKYKESSPWELDYFVFCLDRKLLDGYPDFVFGNWRWDNAMVDYLLLNNVTLIDVSKSVTAFHLGKTSTVQEARKGAAYNDNLLKSYFKDTNNLFSYNGEIDPIVRFGSIEYTQYETIQPEQPGPVQIIEKEKKPFDSN